MTKLPKLQLKGLAALAGLIALSTTALAQEPQSIGTFGKWTAYSLKGGSGTECYIASKPIDTEPKDVRRDPVHFLVTHKSMVNTIIGYNFKKDSTAALTIDSSAFTMITDGDGAWLDTTKKDRQAVLAMKRGNKMIVRGTSWRGTKTKDTYSLDGVTAAMKAIADACK
ncbi:MAG: invasion associated locus B family protein [Pseudomonadota bacterium]